MTMDAFPLDIDEDFTTSESAFDALNTLNPPSPILTPSQLTFAWSSGDIPVLLFDEGYVEECADLSSSYARDRFSAVGLGTCTIPPGSCESLVSSARSSAARASTGINHESDMRASIESSTSTFSMGTFGPKKCRRQTLRTSQISRQSIPFSEDKSQPQSSIGCPVSGAPLDSPLGLAPPSSSSKVFYHPIVFVNPSQTDQTSQTAPIAGSAKHLDTRPDETHDVPEAKSKPVSWISSRSWDYTRYRDFIENENDDKQHRPLVSRHEEPQASPPNAGIPDSFVDDIYAVNSSNEQQILARSTQSPKEHDIPPLVDYRWLEALYVEFLIDQEGFRAAHPSFRFTGSVRFRSPQLHSSDDVMVQFKPISRQVFHFHYAPFETPPILRRITVNGDDTHDYVSRQGLLTLKSNGVYILHGQETPTGAHHHLHVHDTDPAKLHWQLEYLVDDRVADSSGRIMDGEKTLTPLTFLCSPSLLLPSQAKKNNIMHVFKKGVAPKLHPEKLRPPGTLSPNITRGLSVEQGTYQPTYDGPHRRWESDGSRDTETTPKGKSSINQFPRPGATASCDESLSVSDSRRRRNSSAYGHKGSPVELCVNEGYPGDNANAAFTVKGGRPAPTRHIVSPEELAELLDVAQEKEDTQIFYPTKLDRNSNNFAPLTPRPRLTMHRMPLR